MKRAYTYSALLLLILMSLAAACTQPAPVPAGQQTPQGADLAASALTATDAPPGYTFTEGRSKTGEEVGDLAKSLGWESGYVVTYTGYPDEPMGATTITQTLTTYPAARVHEIFALVHEGDRGDQELIITDLPPPGLGDDSFAFSGKATSQILLRPKTGGSPFEHEMTLQGSLKQDVVEIVFIKGTTLEVFRMSGPRAAYPVLLPLAQKAAGRIP